jgi:hypothetical protein
MSVDRTTEHERWEREAAATGCPYPEKIRTLLVTVAGIKFRILAAIISWRADDDNLCCERCGQSLKVIGPNLLHELPLACCACAARLLEPLDDRDLALLELAHPVSKGDARLAEKFHRELSQLTKPKPKKETARVAIKRKRADSVYQNENTNSSRSTK